MAVVQVYRTEWRGWEPEHGSGTFTVYAESTNNRIDHFELNNSGCTLATRVKVYDEGNRNQPDEVVLDVTLTPHQDLLLLPSPRNIIWRHGKATGSALTVTTASWVP